MNILITAASTAHAYQLLGLLGLENNVTLADSFDLPAFMLKNKKFMKIPSGDSGTFAHELLTTCLDLGIHRIFALRPAEVRALAEARTLFSEYEIDVMVPPLVLLEKLEMKSGPGTIVIKDPGTGHLSLPESADYGVFLVNEEGNDSHVSIFTTS